MPFKKRKHKILFKNITLLFFTLISTALIIETFFFFKTESISFGFTKGMQRWMKKYWKPINSHGFRDVEYDSNFLKDKKTVFIIGDSFTAGHGIKNYKNRFSNILHQALQPDYAVLNIAQNGWNTKSHIKALRSFPIEPDVVVLAYFVNDITDAANQHSFYEKNIVKKPSDFIFFLVNNSYFLDYFYWRILVFRSARELEKNSLAFTNFCYTNEKVWQTQEGFFNQIIKYSRKRDSKLVVVGIPHLLNIEKSEKHIKKVLSHFQEKSIPTLNMADHFLDKNPLDLIVGRMDSHPNEQGHQLIADALLQSITLLDKKTK